MNGILLIDKPAGWTSHDVVAKLRGVLRERKIGHSGTLDPMATGLLVVFLGRATRAVQFAEADSKEYVAGLRLGVKTDTQDTTGNVLETREVKIAQDDYQTALLKFTGTYLQTPPMYSAVKVGGRKLYELARAGKEIERKGREVTVFDITPLEDRDGDHFFRVRCSKGTYIRTLCADIGEQLGCGGCMSYLRRTQAGAFSVDNAKTLDDVIEATRVGAAEDLLLPVHTLFSQYEEVNLSENQERRIRNGGGFSCTLPDGVYRAFGAQGEFLALAEVKDGVLSVIKSFYEV